MQRLAFLFEGKNLPPMLEKSLVLLSSGLDSAFNLFQAVRDTHVVQALTFDYGQRAAKKEISQAKILASQVNVPHKVIELPWFSDFTSTALVNTSAVLPQASKVEIDSSETSTSTAKAVWVPNRNGIFLNIAAGFAEGLGAKWVVPGFNKEEAQTFPDNSEEFMQALDHSFAFSTQGRVHVKCYSQSLTKTEIVREAVALHLPFHQLWPCYEAKEAWCRECESCKRFLRALDANGINL